MIRAMTRVFKVEELRKRLFFTFLMLLVIRLGAQLPAPGVNREYIQSFFASQSSDALNFLNMFTGGSLENLSIFALSITPYITASIIMQLLTIAIPKLEEMQKEGEDGRQKISKITRYVAVGLALLESTAMVIGFSRSGLLLSVDTLADKIWVGFIIVVTLTAGSTLLMWIGERITERGVGNGISIVLLINIVSRIPSDFVTLYEKFVKSKTIAKGLLAVAVILAIILAVVIFVIILQDGERRIPVQYSQKMQGRKRYGGQSSHIPLKVNTAGVLPVIFASSLMQFPVIIATLMGDSDVPALRWLNSSNWFNAQHPAYTVGLILYILLTVFFAYFSTKMTFNPLEVANNMKKQGGFIPGIRPGKPTVDYLEFILNYLIFIGVCGLIIVQIIPFFFNGAFGADVSFGGTSLIIIVGVVLETIKQIESQMLVRNYTGFLNDKNGSAGGFLGY